MMTLNITKITPPAVEHWMTFCVNGEPIRCVPWTGGHDVSELMYSLKDIDTVWDDDKCDYIPVKVSEKMRRDYCRRIKADLLALADKIGEDTFIAQCMTDART